MTQSPPLTSSEITCSPTVPGSFQQYDILTTGPSCGLGSVDDIPAVQFNAANSNPNAPATYYAASNGKSTNAPCTTSPNQPCDIATAFAEEASLGAGGTGNVISLANGNYSTGMPALVGGNANVTIKGASKTKVVVSAAAGPVVDLSGANNVVVENLTVTGVATNGYTIQNTAGTNDTLYNVNVAGGAPGGVPSTPAIAIRLHGGQTNVVNVTIQNTAEKACTAKVKNSNVNTNGWGGTGTLLTSKTIPSCSTAALIASGDKVNITPPGAAAGSFLTCGTATVAGPKTLTIASPCTITGSLASTAIPPKSAISFNLTAGVPAYSSAGILEDGGSTQNVLGGTINGGNPSGTNGIAVVAPGPGTANIEGVTVNGNANPTYPSGSPGVGIAVATGGATATNIIPVPATPIVLPTGVTGPASGTANNVASSNQIGVAVASQAGDAVTIGASNAKNTLSGTYAGVALNYTAGSTSVTNNTIGAGTLGGVALACTCASASVTGNSIGGAEFGVIVGNSANTNTFTSNTISGNGDFGVVVMGNPALSLLDYPTLLQFNSSAAGANTWTKNTLSSNGHANIIDFGGNGYGAAPGGTLTLEQPIAAGAAPTTLNLSGTSSAVLVPGTRILVFNSGFAPPACLAAAPPNGCDYGPAPAATDIASFFVTANSAPLCVTGTTGCTGVGTPVSVVTLNSIFDAVNRAIPTSPSTAVVSPGVINLAASSQTYSGGSNANSCTPSNTGGAIHATLGHPSIGFDAC